MPTVIDVPVVWYPQPRQEELVRAAGLLGFIQGLPEARAPYAELIGYGGAAFGGKSDGLLGLAAIAAMAYPGCRIGFFRRTFPELEGAGGAIERSREIFSTIGTYNETRHRWQFITGSALYFNHVQHEADVHQYQSQQFDILLIDEATSFTWAIVDYLLTRNRATIDNLPRPFCVMTTNPGNVGHVWYSQLFDVTGLLGEHRQVKRVQNPNGAYVNSYFIPAFVEDNPIGLGRDPEYVERLEQRDPEIARALRYGDWTVFAGQAFRTWSRARHVVEPFEIDPTFTRWVSLDYGFVHPWVAYWWAKDPNNGRLYIYREAYYSGLTDRQQARKIKDMTAPDEQISFYFASPDMWARKNVANVVTTSADEYRQEGIVLTRADNDRLSGKRKIDRLLVDLPDGKPGIQVFDTCKNLTRVMPILVRAEKDPEDVEKVDGDDPYDAMRYGLTNTRVGSQKKKAEPSPMAAIGVL